MEVLVVGAGAMGRWAGETLRAEFSVAFTDRDRAVADSAATAVSGRSVPLETTETFAAVCLAVPISVVGEAIEAHAGKASRAMIDVTGVMAKPVEAMREHVPTCERASLHPLFAPENAPGNVAVVVDESGPVVDRALDAIAEAGNDIFETGPAEHDTAMETVQAGAHTAILAYALAAEDVREEFATPVSRTLSELVGTVTGGTPRVYREIQESFEGADAVADAARRIADADGETFEQLYEAAGEHPDPSAADDQPAHTSESSHTSENDHRTADRSQSGGGE
ncbi:prephenate dehydrogenase/arogenate dehydrogenase family protein [Halobellus ordinarius]|uniref:prephenate dehydrogenase/arogenate dehydrogenase family protein n=1 Tax=Halobellus ordinarius TaxID=3075120 RepID=UPI0028807052|nr:prephenate dehydrogenase/arogenate dehydrogenase family protein [Halobellus sp. ZY16]